MFRAGETDTTIGYNQKEIIMPHYAAFLRAVNVGGSKIIRMKNLRNVFESLKLKNVRTFIQSGNVLFYSDFRTTPKLRTGIETQLTKSFNYEITTMIRSKKDIENIIKKNPFAEEKLGKDLSLYIALLGMIPGKKTAEEFLSLADDNEKYVIMKDNVYCLIRKNVKTRFSNNYIEKKLGLNATTRNMNTIQKIFDILITPSRVNS